MRIPFSDLTPINCKGKEGDRFSSTSILLKAALRTAAAARLGPDPALSGRAPSKCAAAPGWFCRAGVRFPRTKAGGEEKGQGTSHKLGHRAPRLSPRGRRAGEGRQRGQPPAIDNPRAQPHRGRAQSTPVLGHLHQPHSAP